MNIQLIGIGLILLSNTIGIWLIYEEIKEIRKEVKPIR